MNSLYQHPSPLPKQLYNPVITDQENIDYQTSMLLLLLKYKRGSLTVVKSMNSGAK